MDKPWISMNRLSFEYRVGVNNFLQFVEQNAESRASIRCPCTSCGNFLKWSPKDIKDHLYINGIDQSYQIWIWHGENAPGSPPPSVNIHDFMDQNYVASTIEMVQALHEDSTENSETFQMLLEDAQKPLYKGGSTDN